MCYVRKFWGECTFKLSPKISGAIELQGRIGRTVVNIILSQSINHILFSECTGIRSVCKTELMGDLGNDLAPALIFFVIFWAFAAPECHFKFPTQVEIMWNPGLHPTLGSEARAQSYAHGTFTSDFSGCGIGPWIDTL